MKTTGKQRGNGGKRLGGITGKGFRPGRSGNPQGRPRTARFSEAARQLASEIGTSGLTGAEALAQYCFHRALKGSARHAELFLNYSEGKPKQGVELSGISGEPIRFSDLTREQIDERVTALLEKRNSDATER
ncbi:MAG: DUF5681 domain-containing protein [Candidatus Acidiferrum sp.]|jgi:hypothetical protein